MIIGRGDIAKEIPDREGFIFYASGCSNRTEITNYARNKEYNDIKFQAEKIGNKMFVFFSTLSIYYSESVYTKHKMVCEKLVNVYFRNYTIIRLGNIDWGDNPNTLINHLKRDPSNIQETYRYILNKEEFRHWCSMIPEKGQHIMNVTGKLTWVPDLVKTLNIPDDDFYYRMHIGQYNGTNNT